MKPKTKLQHTVVGISKTLKPLSKQQKDNAIANIFNKYGTIKYKSLICLECAHKWRDETILGQILKLKVNSKPFHFTCPSCQQKLRFVDKATSYTFSDYFMEFDVKSDFQIVRIYYIQKILRKEIKPQYFTHEVIQHFIGMNGKITSMAMPSHLSYYGDNWYGDLSIMKMNYTDVHYYATKGTIVGSHILPKPKFHPKIKRNGFNGSLHGISPQILFPLILRNNRAETLLKLKLFELLKIYSENQKYIDNYWNTLKICFRNNYIIPKGRTKDYFDYLSMLEYFQRDLYSPKYVCPVDLNREHNKYNNKMRAIRRKEELEELKLKMDEQQVKYHNSKSAYFDLCFTEGDITIRVLKEVKEFYMVGELLRHCIYENKYFDKKDSLIFITTVNNKIVETSEVYISELKVEQSRGFENEPTEYTERICEILDNNMDKIRAIRDNNKVRRRKANIQLIKITKFQTTTTFEYLI